MKTKARKSCQKCARLQAKVDAQQAELDAQKRRIEALEAKVARLLEQLAAAAKIPRHLPSRPLPISSSRPSLRLPMVRPDARSVVNPVTLYTNGIRSRPRPSTPGPSIIVSIFVPGAAMGWNPQPGASPV